MSTSVDTPAKVNRKPKVLDPDTGEYVAPCKLRQKQVAAEAMKPGATYKEVGEKLYPNSSYPAQTVYNALRQPTAQAELKQIEAVMGITRDQYIARVVKHAEIAENRTNKGKASASDVNAATGALTLLGKASGNLVEKVESKVTNTLDTKDLHTIPDDQLQAEIVKRLRGRGSAA